MIFKSGVQLKDYSITSYFQVGKNALTVDQDIKILSKTRKGKKRLIILYCHSFTESRTLARSIL